MQSLDEKEINIFCAFRTPFSGEPPKDMLTNSDNENQSLIDSEEKSDLITFETWLCFEIRNNIALGEFRWKCWWMVDSKAV